ncbi:MAG: hypothetical protein ABW040_03960 [Microbacteriaceae bacterium]
MTIISPDHDATTSTSTASTGSPIMAHPSMGTSTKAQVTPITATVFQVSMGDRIVGYVESVDAIWKVRVGSRLAPAAHVHTATSFASALRHLAQGVR